MIAGRRNFIHIYTGEKQCSKIFPADLAKLADEGADIFFSI